MTGVGTDNRGSGDWWFKVIILCAATACEYLNFKTRQYVYTCMFTCLLYLLCNKIISNADSDKRGEGIIEKYTRVSFLVNIYDKDIILVCTL